MFWMSTYFSPPSIPIVAALCFKEDKLGAFPLHDNANKHSLIILDEDSQG